MAKSKTEVEFGDFQTPLSLAKEVVFTIDSLENYGTIIEPTCGLGSFLQACIDARIDTSKLKGWEINPRYVKQANESFKLSAKKEIVTEQDFFSINWHILKSSYQNPVLFIGNPPWVTNSALGSIDSQNLPGKRNIHNYSGYEAMTGKSNFDISEWMLIQLVNFISGTESSLAFLLKTSVARKIFSYITKHKLKISDISIRKIDAKKSFGVSVDACLFRASGMIIEPKLYECRVYDNITDNEPAKIMGIIAGKLVSDLAGYQKLSHIDKGCEFKWRSGVKHDASKVMEFEYDGYKLINGYGQEVNLPWEHLYPMYKSSHISKKNIIAPQRYMLITQKKINDETKYITTESPETWEYLLKYAEKLDKRKSSIYKNAPRFAVFGVGEYTFSPWKVVISSLYKNIRFSKIGLYQGKPIVVDDTCYMLGFESEKQADLILKILNSEISLEFIQSIIFNDDKRIVSAAVLNRISIKELAKELGLLEYYTTLFEANNFQLSFL